MEVLFSDAFKDSLKKYSSTKKFIKKKVDMIIENPIAYLLLYESSTTASQMIY